MRLEEAKNLIKSVLSGKAVMTFFANIERIAKALETTSSDKVDRNCGLSDENAEKVRAYARETYLSEGSLEIDENAQISDSKAAGGDNGAYVQAWVWVDYDDAKVKPKANPVLDALSALLSLTNDLKDDLEPAEYKRWQAISAQEADWRNGEDV